MDGGVKRRKAPRAEKSTPRATAITPGSYFAKFKWQKMIYDTMAIFSVMRAKWHLESGFYCRFPPFSDRIL